MYWHPPYKCFGKFVFVFPAPVVCRKENKKKPLLTVSIAITKIEAIMLRHHTSRNTT